MITTTQENDTAGGLRQDTATFVVYLTFAPAELDDKATRTERAPYCVTKDEALRRTDHADEPHKHWTERWGLVRHLTIIDAARRFLEQVGGRL